jgi:hypothetical protein
MHYPQISSDNLQQKDKIKIPNCFVIFFIINYLQKESFYINWIHVSIAMIVVDTHHSRPKYMNYELTLPESDNRLLPV